MGRRVLTPEQRAIRDKFVRDAGWCTDMAANAERMRDWLNAADWHEKAAQQYDLAGKKRDANFSRGLAANCRAFVRT